ncbi:MAG: glycosyltransferase family 39 protein [Myxococcota bacterium]
MTQDFDQRRALLVAGGVLAILGSLLVVGAGTFGIWDHWELNRADEARQLLSGDAIEVTHPMLGSWLVAMGFETFGVAEWAGRAPIALFGLLAVVFAYLLVARFVGRRAGIYAAIVAGTSPLFVFNSRLMLGEAPAFFAQAALALSAGMLVFYAPSVQRVVTRSTGEGPYRAAERRETVSNGGAWIRVGIWSAVTLLALAFAVSARGALLGALPPLFGVVAAGWFGTRDLGGNRQRQVALGLLTALTCIVTYQVFVAVSADADEYSMWLGGRPRGGDPPTFEVAIETIFHSFAPWSALLPFALGRLLVGVHREPTESEEGTDWSGAFRLMLIVWLSAGYGALTLFGSRYGASTYIPVVALAAAIAVMLHDAERTTEDRKGSWWAAAVIAGLFTGLIIRDYRLYPDSPVAGLGLSDLTLDPETFEMTTYWPVALAIFAATAVVTFSAVGRPARPWVEVSKTFRKGSGFLSALAENGLDLRAPYRLIRTQWARGLEFKAWLVFIAVLLGLGLLFGILCFIPPIAEVLTTIVVK